MSLCSVKSFFYAIFILFLDKQFINAQNLPKEINVQNQPFEGKSIKRVGSAPLPITTQNLEAMTAPTFTLPSKGTNIIPSPQGGNLKKLPYESTYMSGRIIFLNGNNISSVREQELENVSVFIDSKGHIHITAPHYEVGVEQSYHPMLPSELPKLPKSNLKQIQTPKGTYSKETGKKVTSPILPNQFAPPVAEKDISTPSKQNKQATTEPLPENAEDDNLEVDENDEVDNPTTNKEK